MVQILDTTLREGEQTPGVTFSNSERLTIAKILDEFGVDIIEAGHPKVSTNISNSIKEISNHGLNAEILAHCRALKEDIDSALICDVDWVGIFYCISDKRLKKMFKTTLKNATEQITDSIEYAKDHGLKVRFTPEDSFRTEYRSLIYTCYEAILSKVDRISLADTVGAMTPIGIYNFIKRLKNDLKIELNIHCHNDLGLASANALAAFEAGASLIDVTVNGLGERAGISSISEICTALDTIYKVKNNWNLDLISELSNVVSNFSGIDIPSNTPIIGENAFVHNAGLHVAAVINDPSFYEAFPAEKIGKNRSFILDKMAGTHTIQHKLEQLKIPISKDNISKALEFSKQKDKGTISNNELLTLFNRSDFNNIGYQ